MNSNWKEQEIDPCHSNLGKNSILPAYACLLIRTRRENNAYHLCFCRWWGYMLVYVIYTSEEIAKFSPRMLFLHLLCVYVGGVIVCRGKRTSCGYFTAWGHEVELRLLSFLSPVLISWAILLSSNFCLFSFVLFSPTPINPTPLHRNSWLRQNKLDIFVDFFVSFCFVLFVFSLWRINPVFLEVVPTSSVCKQEVGV